MSRLAIAVTLISCLPLTSAYSQQSPRLTFDVVSIHPADPNEVNGIIRALPGGNGYIAKNVTAKLMISLMYKVPMRQITGGPAWLDSDRFDVDARVDGQYSLDDLHIMFQNLLADRFQLRFHKDTRQGNVYALTVDKSGLKMKPNTSPQDFKIPVTPGPNNSYTGVRVPMPYLCWFLGQALQSDERPVVNRTGLDGNYDFSLSFAPVLPPAARDNAPSDAFDRPSLFVAVKEQLGLKLDSTRGPVDFYVIDTIERPSAN